MRESFHRTAEGSDPVGRCSYLVRVKDVWNGPSVNKSNETDCEITTRHGPVKSLAWPSNCYDLLAKPGRSRNRTAKNR